MASSSSPSSPSAAEEEQKTQFMIVGVATALVPVYLFQTLKNMPLLVGWNLAVFALGTVFNAVVLTIAYGAVAARKAAQLGKSSDAAKAAAVARSSKGGASPAEAKAAVEALQEREAMLHSIAVNNAVFLGLTGALGFLVFRALTAPYHYILSVTIAALLTSILSSSSSSSSAASKADGKK